MIRVQDVHLGENIEKFIFLRSAVSAAEVGSTKPMLLIFMIFTVCTTD